jgi:hypothetical protein
VIVISGFSEFTSRVKIKEPVLVFLVILYERLPRASWHYVIGFRLATTVVVGISSFLPHVLKK